jgi:hypothetical protein
MSFDSLRPVLCCAVLCCAVLCCPVLSCAVLCCPVLSCAVLCCPVLCCAPRVPRPAAPWGMVGFARREVTVMQMPPLGPGKAPASFFNASTLLTRTVGASGAGAVLVSTLTTPSGSTSPEYVRC